MKGNLRKNGSKEMDLTKAIFNTEEAAAFLQITTTTLKKQLNSGQIPGRKVGRAWRISREQLQQMFSTSK
jgi:excisionase family DNA binding protein